MKAADIVRVLEHLAPPALAAEWDNVGLLIGSGATDVRKLLFCVDMTQGVLDEVRKVKAQMVMAYHPPILKPISRVTAGAAPLVYRAAEQGLAVYSMHTAMDAAPGGTNDVLGDLLGLKGSRPLESVPGAAQCKVVVFVPPADLSSVAEAAFAAGGGRIGNYYDCAFFSHGIGAFCGAEGSHPSVGQAGRHEATEEARLEFVCPRAELRSVCDAIRAAHSYEEPAIDVYTLEDARDGRGLGRVGRLDKPTSVAVLVERIKKQLGLRTVQVALCGARTDKVTTAACSAGSAGSMYQSAVRAGATFYLTGEMRHHDVLAAVRAGMNVVCVGHSHSERIALPKLAQRVRSHLPKLQVHLSRQDKDPFVTI